MSDTQNQAPAAPAAASISAVTATVLQDVVSNLPAILDIVAKGGVAVAPSTEGANRAQAIEGALGDILSILENIVPAHEAAKIESARAKLEGRDVPHEVSADAAQQQ